MTAPTPKPYSPLNKQNHLAQGFSKLASSIALGNSSLVSGIGAVLPKAIESNEYPMLTNILKSLTLDNDRPKVINYDQVFTSPWAPTYEMVSSSEACWIQTLR